MKNEDLILLAAMALGVFVVIPAMLKKSTAKPGGTDPASSSIYATREIMRADGWTYYTDGTSIDPNGRYYKGSDLVYDPRGMYQS
jgi:hypothetical protein